MTEVAFIGLGIMGLPMAINLVEAGHHVTGYNRSPEKVKRLEAAGGRGANSVAEAVASAEIIFTMLPDSPDVEDVFAGEGGILAHAQPGALWIDASTIRPAVARNLSERAADAGLRALDAPVSGGEKGAVDGVLSIMVGGSAADFESAQTVFDAVGKTIVHVGPAGSGQTVKAANQLMVAANIEALAEALVFLEASGVDLESSLAVLGGGLAGSKVLEQKGSKMIARDFAPGFRLELHHKDLGIAMTAAREAGVATPLGAAVAQLVAASVSQGEGALDHSGLVKNVLRLSGRSV